MDLLKKLQNEVKLLQLKDKLVIARFLYIRTGEIFEYDEAFFTYHNMSKNQKKIFYDEIDIHKVKKFRAVCASWARMFVKLLSAFDISGIYVEDDYYWHAYVKFYIDKKVYVADMTGNFEDIVNIKFGLQTLNFYHPTAFFSDILKNLNKKLDLLEIDKVINYYKGIYTDEVLTMIKKEIYAIFYTNDLQLIEKVFEVIMLIINIERPNINFFSGSIYIIRLLEFFLGNLKDYVVHSDVYDKERLEFKEVIVNTYGEDMQFFLYEKNEDGYFKLQKVSKMKIRKIAECYKCEHKKVLKLAK